MDAVGEFRMTAFKNLPPWGDFVKGKESDMLFLRRAFTERLEQLHRHTLAKHSQMKSEHLEEEAWELWQQKQAGRTKRRKQGGPRMPCPACCA